MRPRVGRVLLFVVLVAACALLAYATNRAAHQDIRNHERRDSDALFKAQLASCQRVNVLRRLFNDRGDALVAWVATESSLNMRITRDPYRQTLPPGMEAILRAHVRALRALADSYGPVALTDCRKEIHLRNR